MNLKTGYCIYITKVPKQHQLGKAIYYVLNYWEALTNYLKDDRLEIDNNKIENFIRPLAIGRKNYLFMGSPDGCKAGAIFIPLLQRALQMISSPINIFVRCFIKFVCVKMKMITVNCYHSL